VAVRAAKFEAADLTPQASQVVVPPRVRECPLQLEATVTAIRKIGLDQAAACVETEVIRVHAPGDRRRGDEPCRPEEVEPAALCLRVLRDAGSARTCLSGASRVGWIRPRRGTAVCDPCSRVGASEHGRWAPTGSAMFLRTAVGDQRVGVGEEKAVAINARDVDLLGRAQGDRCSTRIENVHARGATSVPEDE